jgi:hypothetical protein
MYMGDMPRLFDTDSMYRIYQSRKEDRLGGGCA